MKWIGQHIWDYISRFRNDVYLEDIDSGTIASGGNLGLDSNNKIVKSASPSGSIDLTSEVTGTLPVANGGTGATSLADNSILTGTGTSAITAEANFTYNGSALSVDAVTSTFLNAISANVYIQNTGNNAGGGILSLYNTRNGAPCNDADNVGMIRFWGNNDASTPITTEVVRIQSKITDATSGAEEGLLEIQVASHNGTLTNGLLLESGNASGEVDVTVGNGSTSLTTVAGDAMITSNIELGHASDTTIARSAAGTVTIEGEQIFTTNVPDLTSGAAGVPAVIMHTRRTITTAEANSMNTTPIELVPGQGANTVIVPIGGIIRVDRAATQTNSAADLNMHYAGLAPGIYNLTSLAHIRRFMWNETGDRVFNITAMVGAYEVAQNLTSDSGKALQVSFDSATTTDCFTSIDIFLTYQVISIA